MSTLQTTDLNDSVVTFKPSNPPNLNSSITFEPKPRYMKNRLIINSKPRLIDNSD